MRYLRSNRQSQGGVVSYQKCKFMLGGYLEESCKALKDAVELFPTRKSKGLYAQNRVMLSDNRSLGTAVLLKSGGFRERGVLLNYCPFCGNQIRDVKDGEA